MFVFFPPVSVRVFSSQWFLQTPLGAGFMYSSDEIIHVGAPHFRRHFPYYVRV